MLLGWVLNMDSTTGYDIFIDNSFLTTVVGSSLIVSELSPYTTYVFTVQAFNETGSRSGTATDSAMTQDNTPPTMPGNIQASPVSETQVNLSWLTSVDNDQVAGYEIRMGLDEVGMGPILATTTNLYYNATGLTSGQTVYFDVRAYDRAGNFSASARRGVVLPDLTAPTVPGNLTATPSGFNMQLQWDDSYDAGTLIGYTINKNGSPYAFSPISEFLDVSYSGSTDTTYSVIAVDAAGNTSSAAVVTVASVDRLVNATLLWTSGTNYTTILQDGHRMFHAVDPVNGVIVATSAGLGTGVRSLDRGVTWIASGALSSTELLASAICRMHYDPVNACFWTHIRNNSSPVSMRFAASVDNGATFAVVNAANNGASNYALGFAIHPVNGQFHNIGGSTTSLTFNRVTAPRTNFVGTFSTRSYTSSDQGENYGMGYIGPNTFVGAFGSSLLISSNLDPLNISPTPHYVGTSIGTNSRAIAFGYGFDYGLSLVGQGAGSVTMRKFSFANPTTLPDEVVSFLPATSSGSVKAGVWFTNGRFIVAVRHATLANLVLLKWMDPSNGVWSATTHLTLPYSVFTTDSSDRSNAYTWQIEWLGGLEYTFSFINSATKHTICKFVF